MMNGKIDQLVGSMVRPIAGSLLVAGALFCFGLMSGHAQTVDPISADDSAIEVEGSDHRFKIFGSERLASIESRTLFEKTNTNVNHGQAQALSRRVYEHFHDDFDFIIFASNQSAVPAGSYYGRFYEAQNKIEGVGKRQFDNTSNFGSQGRLQGVIHLTSTWGLTGGPSLHEITHKWGNDMVSVPTDVGSHWGYSNIGGQLGGWQPGSLVELGDNKYKARNPNTGEFGSWGSFANGGNGLPYSEFELYTMGLIEASEVGHDIKIAKDFIWVEPGKGIFSASSINTVTMDEVIEIDGLRSPGPSESQKQFRILYVILTDKPLTLSQWQSYDEDVSNFQIQEDNGSSLYNFWEATRGLASLKMDELAKSVKVKNAYTISIDPNTNIALDSTIGAVGLNGSVWDWYSNDTPSDPRNSLSVFLAEVRNSETHLMLHDGGEPGVLTQTSGGTTSDYNYNGIPGDDNDASARGVILKYKATAERTLLIETAGGENNNSVVVIFTETHLDNGEEPFKVVTHDSTDQTAFKVRFPYSVNNPSDNIYYIGLTSYNRNDLNLVAPIKITADPLHPVIELSADSTEVQWAHTTGVDDSGMQYDLAHPIGFKAPEGMTVVLVNKGNRIVHDTGLNEVSDVHQYLVDVGDQDGRGFASMFYMTSYGHAWDYWKSTYVAKAGEDGDGDGVADNLDVFPNDVIELSADGTEIQWAHTTGINNSGMRYDMAHPIGFKAPAGMTVVLVNKGEEIVHDTGLNEVSDVHQYLVDVGDQDGRGLAAMFYMSITTLRIAGSDGGEELPHVWDYWPSTYVAKAVIHEGRRLSLSALNHNYDGNEKNVTVTTEPSGLNVVVTYTDSEGSAVANPTNAGTYTVTATIDDGNNSGSATETLTINKAEAGITVSGTSQTYDGSAKTATATTEPAGLSVVVTYTDSEGTAVSSVTEIGEYTVVATVDDDNYHGSTSVTLSIGEGEPFGEPVTFTNIATTLIGQVTINGTAAREGDVVAFYVGEELRGKQAVNIDINGDYSAAGTAWLNAQVHAAGGEETSTIRVYEVSTGITHDKVGLSVEIKPEGEAGAFAEPLLIQMDNVAPELTLLGEAQVTIDQRTTYADAGASATDNVDGDLTSKIVVTGAVDTSTAGTYTLKYDVSDAAGNAAESVSRTVVVEKTTVIQTVNLKAGWNLISFYVESEDMAPSTVLASIKVNLLQIKDLKNSYNPTLPAFINTLKGLNVKDGYWVKVSEATSFELEGSVPAGGSIPVRTGWNLVGYPKENGAAPANELTSLGNTVLQFKNLKNSYNPALPAFINTLKVITPGLGYWLKVSEKGVWNVGDVSSDGANRGIVKLGPDDKGPGWGQVVVYPNVGATVLAEVFIIGEAVTDGSVVGAFMGDELRGEHEVVLADGRSYVAINVNLQEAEKVSFRIWDAGNNKEYEVTKSMTLEMGEMYGTAEEFVKLNGVASGSGSTLRIVVYEREPFGFGFESQTGSSYVVEATGDLKEWGTVKTYNGTGTMIRFVDERDQVFPRIYYRVKVVE